METVTLARPYARAAFALAQAQSALDAWSSHLTTAAALARNPGMDGWSNDPRVGPETLASLYRPQDVAEDAPFARFLATMATHGRLPLLPEVAQLFEAFRRDAEHVVKARLRCAAEPQPDQVERLLQTLKQRHQCSVELEVDVDASMIGGAVLDIDNNVVDGSIRARLSQLQTALMR